jgi:carbonic anhydrase
MIDQIIDFNKSFVAQKNYEKYLTDKYPDKKLAVLSCMDTRLTELLPAALGLTHPLVPKDIVVRGFIIDSETGALEEIQ